MPRLLLVEKDPFMQRTLLKLLGTEGYSCTVAADGEETRLALGKGQFDLLVLHVVPPRAEGMEVLRQIRLGHHVPILLLAPRNGVVDTVGGLEGGADDYLSEPFDPRELVARVRAQLRRADEYSLPVSPDSRINLGLVILDVERREAFRDGIPLNLTTREFEVLHLLAQHRNKALASKWIFESVWGYAAHLGIKTLTVYIGRLRRKIEADPRHPQTLLSIRGFGYKLVTGEQ